MKGLKMGSTDYNMIARVLKQTKAPQEVVRGLAMAFLGNNSRFNVDLFIAKALERPVIEQQPKRG
jgi:hypothetical protein